METNLHLDLEVVLGDGSQPFEMKSKKRLMSGQPLNIIKCCHNNKCESGVRKCTSANERFGASGKQYSGQ